MLKTVSLLALALLIALGGGAWSVYLALERGAGTGAIAAGPWTAYPDLGTLDADPYTRARYARDGNLALGQAEGIEFQAETDSAGNRLTSNCNYRVEGTMPPARFWTLRATNEQGSLLDTVGERSAALSSLYILRAADGDAVSINVGTEPATGNWLAVSGSGAMQLVLSFYDAPIANQVNAADSVFPTIRRISCDG